MTKRPRGFYWVLPVLADKWTVGEWMPDGDAPDYEYWSIVGYCSLREDCDFAEIGERIERAGVTQ